MVLGFAACGKSTEEKIAEKIVKEIAEEIGDANGISVDTENGGKITISDGEDQLVFESSEDGMPWPSDELPANVPELKGIIVVSVANVNEGVLIGFEGCDNDEALTYKEEITSAGWNVLLDMGADTGGMLTTSNDDGETLMFVWDTEEEGGAITYTPAP